MKTSMYHPNPRTRICCAVTDAASEYVYVNWMYQHDAVYRSIIEEERREREERKTAEERHEAELDARNPLMTRFTKKVIAALEARVAYIRENYPSANVDGRTYCMLCDVYDIIKRYRTRLEHFQGLR